MKSLKSIFLAFSLIFATNLKANTFMTADSVLTGPQYATDIFYSMKNGQVATADRMNWDIAFHTPLFSATILTNGAAGVNLYTYPSGDTNSWNAIDTTGLSTWVPLYDHPDEWENGAFNRNQLGHPDYGWGKYNPITHEVIGDSLYIIKLRDGSFKKLWIVKRGYINGQPEYTYVIKYADLDNANEQLFTLNTTPYLDKNFVYYSLQTNELLDREPASETYDIIFTKYMSIQPNGMPYPTTGVLNNFNVAANRFEGVTLDFNDYWAAPLDTAKSPIGWDWKTFNMGTFQWTVEDSLLYFVQDLDGDIYKLYFTRFEGSSTGKVVFMKELRSAMKIDDPVVSSEMKIHPNPAMDHINLTMPGSAGEVLTVQIVDLSGRTVFSSQLYNTTEESRIDISNIEEGAYLVRASTGGKVYSNKLIISR